MRTDDFDYDLPPELIAQHPPERRDASRMMVVHRETGEIEHRAFTDFPGFLESDDLLVLNDTRVTTAGSRSSSSTRPCPLPGNASSNRASG